MNLKLLMVVCAMAPVFALCTNAIAAERPSGMVIAQAPPAPAAEKDKETAPPAGKGQKPPERKNGAQQQQPQQLQKPVQQQQQQLPRPVQQPAQQQQLQKPAQQPAQQQQPQKPVQQQQLPKPVQQPAQQQQLQKPVQQPQPSSNHCKSRPCRTRLLFRPSRLLFWRRATGGSIRCAARGVKRTKATAR